MKVLFLDMAGTFVRVSDEDFEWARQWLWSKKASRAKKRSDTPRKLYAYRIGRRGSWRGSIYLHVDLCERLHGPPTSRQRRIAEHKNGDSLDCTNENLPGWVTAKQNRRTARPPMREEVQRGDVT